MRIVARGSILVALVALCGAASAQGRGPAAPAGWVAETNLEYARVGEVSLMLDVVHPAQVDGVKLPLVVFIHGGGWRSGSKERGYDRLAPLVATTRYVGATIGYRLTPSGAIWPAQIHDCKGALRWLRANAARFGIDPARVAVWGTSAGGHLAALLGTSAGEASLEGPHGNTEHTSRVQAAIDFCGPADMRFAADGARSQLSALFGGSGEAIRALATSASPIVFVDRDDPPFLIVHGEDDRTVPIRQSTAFDAALRAAGVDCTFVPLPGVGHSITGDEVKAKVLAFLDRVLAPTTDPAAINADLERVLGAGSGSR